jgi:hypothetical protein
MPGCPSMVTNSKVARPSGPLNDQVISHTPRAETIGLTRNDPGQRWRPGVDTYESQLAVNSGINDLKIVLCSVGSDSQSLMNLGVDSYLTTGRVS